MKRKNSSSAGVALVIVLGFLVIISALAVAFFSSVTTELKASRNFASGVTTRQLSDSAVNVVMGQIREATSRTDAAWASQPGMIRTYRNKDGTPGSSANAFYKLYSSENMVATESQLSEFVKTPDYVLDWDKRPAVWTDLNSPVLVANPANPALPNVPRFPIIDPRAMGEVEGFEYKAGAVNNTQLGKPEDRRVPMPVRWIYVLQDGTLTTPTGGTGTAPTWTAAGATKYKSPSKANPIVGRIAFWADDETSKVNLNTAAGFITTPKTVPAAYQNNISQYAGSYWDTPRFYTVFDRGLPYKESKADTGDVKLGPGLPIVDQASGGLALCQLLQNEFQRYPGHPATTSLGLVFTNMSNGTSPFDDAAVPEQANRNFYKILPRLGTTNSKGSSPGTSEGGTFRVRKGKDIPNAVPDTLQVQPKADRLYASIDELLFSANNRDALTGDMTKPTFERQTNDTLLQYTSQGQEPTKITPEFLDKMRFFITAQSRAPELNLYGQPRVTVWPVRHETDTEATGLNAFDKVILFCSSVGGNEVDRPNTTTDPFTNLATPYRYIFTRREVNPNTDTTLNGTTKQYDLAAAFVADIDRSRNKQLMKYLQTLTSKTKPIPGFGSSFADKYNTNNQSVILTEIFDYIRCANSQDTTTTISSVAPSDGKPKPFAARGIIMPSLPTYLANATARGFGRLPTIAEATLVFYYAGPKMDNTGTVEGKPNTGWSKWDQNAPARTFAYINPTNNSNKRPTRLMRAFLLLSTFDPMQGYAPFTDPIEKDPKLSIEVTWPSSPITVDFGSGAQQTGFPSGSSKPSTTVYRAPGGTWGGRNFGGYEGFMHTLVGQDLAANFTWAPYKIMWAPGVALTATDVGNSTLATGNTSNAFTSIPTNQQEYYPFQTSLPALEVPLGIESFKFNGASLTAKLYYGGKLIQTLALEFPQAASWPVPGGDPAKTTSLIPPPPAGTVTADVTTWLGVAKTDALNYNAMKDCYWPSSDVATAVTNAGTGTFFSGYAGGRVTKPSPYKYETSLQASWSLATRIAWARQQSYNPVTDANRNPVNYYGDRWKCVLQPGDTVKSLIYWDGNNKDGSPLTGVDKIKGGDLRVATLSPSIASSEFQPHPDYSKAWSRACMLRVGDGSPYFPVGTLANGGAPAKALAVSGDPTKEATFGNHVVLGSGQKFSVGQAFGNLPWAANDRLGVNGVVRDDKKEGDFDTGLGNFADGAFFNKQDEGNVVFAYYDSYLQRYIYPIPYFSTYSYESAGNTYTSPFREMPSAVMMGSLLSRPADKKGWQTLAFSPRQAGDSHPGNVDPKDHLLLDLFHMPIVEPYPISEPFSTAGKVNLNYLLAPFDYITRSTALRATLHPLRVTAVPTTDYKVYKTGDPNAAKGEYDAEKGQTAPLTQNYRKRIDRDATIKGFETFFDNGRGTNGLPDKGFFKSASQICEMDLYPEGIATTLDFWWSQGKLTGDNVREKPYCDLYPRITTKSNTYCVHFRVQTLSQLPRATSDEYATKAWVEGKDNILGEYRGATTIERYIDPSDPRFTPGHKDASNVADAINPDSASVEPLYRFRTVVNKKFDPH